MLDHRYSARKRRCLTAALALASLALAPAIAQAGVGAVATPTFPTTVTVGQTGALASITLGRANTAPNVVDSNRVCNTGDVNPCDPADPGIVLIPACKLLVGGVCTVAGADPGVFSIASTATGTAGTCVGMTFTTAPLNDAFGTVKFIPTGGQHVDLPTNASTCEIGFAFSVLKSPTGDQDPSTPGNQVAQTTRHVQCVLPCAPGNLSNNAQGTSNGTTVLRAGPTITTNASANVAVGGMLSDQATVTGLVNPVAGATVTFRLYGPGDTTCAKPPLTTDQRPVTLAGTTGTAQSGNYAPTTPGTYSWVATYDGDTNNLPVTGACGAESETRTVTIPCTEPPAMPPAGGTICTKPPPPPPPPPPPAVCTTPPGPAPAGGVLCARGTAAIRGRTGCQGSAFNVVVSGRQIQSVVFTLDGKVVRRLTKPNSGTRYKLAVNPRRLATGVHRVLARTTFTKSSGTKSRVLRVTFSRCARRAAAPAFTG